MSFKYTQLRTNSVVRWEFRPGSTLFVVWAHGRDGSEHGQHESVVVAGLSRSVQSAPGQHVSRQARVLAQPMSDAIAL